MFFASALAPAGKAPVVQPKGAAHFRLPFPGRRRKQSLTMALFAHCLQSPIGPLFLAANSQSELVRIAFGLQDSHEQFLAQCAELAPHEPVYWSPEPLSQAVFQLEAYFRGTCQAFSLPLRPHGTDFQRLVWQELCRIPFGQTRSYAELARGVGNPGAVRAVGRANGANPLPIVIPCHRVIAADGSLGGFSAGLELKRWLLKHEGVPLPPEQLSLL